MPQPRRNSSAEATSTPAYRDVFAKWMRQGDAGLSANDWACVRNTMSTTTGSEGGFTVPSTVNADIFTLARSFSAMRAVATNLRTADGTAYPFPTSDGTAEVGELIAQNTTATAADPTFGTASITPYKFSSKIVAVPYELLQDSAVDLEAWLFLRLAQRIARAANSYLTTGTGTNQPFGIVTQAAAGKVGIVGQTLTVIYDDIIDLIASVDVSYCGPGSGFMMSDATWRVVQKLKDSAGAPLITQFPTTAARVIAPGMQGDLLEPVAPVAGTLLCGYPVWVNNNMAVPAANAKSILFGDFSKYVIRDVVGNDGVNSGNVDTNGGAQILRFTDSAYVKLGQVGFLCFARTGGNLLDANAVKYYQHSAT